MGEDSLCRHLLRRQTFDLAPQVWRCVDKSRHACQVASDMDDFLFHSASYPVCWEPATLFIHSDDNAPSSLTPSTKSIFSVIFVQQKLLFVAEKKNKPP